MAEYCQSGGVWPSLTAAFSLFLQKTLLKEFIDASQ